ncbi:type IV secretory system conjugative DNA transfer family protein [Candidatus Finniella inopinata]|uniref:TraD/TraG TraM recognition site domain-containing protein n=1 Tax=Candidatus Finniella inopinata TaxID=1696036 RepID=A0A4Q7DFQ7_9PROT|nr:type IV secretion system DNA-binding domain-containing protein [Candidatus Finniella inopinata]RZI45482.1 hypothetical protein EQU50_06980 [Candidatus Finniella inopinata]
MNVVETFHDLRASLPSETKRSILNPVSLKWRFSFKDTFLTGLVLWLILWLSFWYIFTALGVQHPGDRGADIGSLGMFCFWLWPFLSLIKMGLKLFKPRWEIWNRYSKPQQFVACLALVAVVGNLVDSSYTFLQPYLKRYQILQENKKTPPLRKSSKKHRASPPPSFCALYLGNRLFAWPVASFFLFCLMLWLSVRDPKPKKQSLKNSPASPLPFSLWLGQSTGKLSRLWHPAGLSSEQEIGLSLEDAAQNILILGAIGSGKTTRGMNPLLLQLLDQDCGGLIFDIKGDFKQAVFYLANMTNREPTLVGVGQQSLNLLAGLSPEMASSFLKSAFLLSNTKMDSFWTDTATELFRNTLGILLFVPEQYHLNGIYRYLFDETFQQRVLKKAIEKSKSDLDERLFISYHQYVHVLFNSFDQKIRDGVMASMMQILSPFQHPSLVDAFCSPQSVQTHPMEAVLDGALYVVDLPLAQWGLGGKIVYTLIKLRFFNVMQQRAIQPNWNQTRPVFFMCDEYQEIVSANKDGLSDLNFWDKSRSSKTIGILSAQSVSSFYAAIGDRDLVHALLQNFRQKLVFRVEDDWTIGYCNRLLGQVETQRLVHSSSSGERGSRSSTQSIHYQQKDLIDGQLFRQMNPDQVLSLLSVPGKAADDILTVKPIFVS